VVQIASLRVCGSSVTSGAVVFGFAGRRSLSPSSCPTIRSSAMSPGQNEFSHRCVSRFLRNRSSGTFGRSAFRLQSDFVCTRTFSFTSARVCGWPSDAPRAFGAAIPNSAFASICGRVCHVHVHSMFRSSLGLSPWQQVRADDAPIAKDRFDGSNRRLWHDGQRRASSQTIVCRTAGGLAFGSRSKWGPTASRVFWHELRPYPYENSPLGALLNWLLLLWR